MVPVKVYTPAGKHMCATVRLAMTSLGAFQRAFRTMDSANVSGAGPGAVVEVKEALERCMPAVVEIEGAVCQLRRQRRVYRQLLQHRPPVALPFEHAGGSVCLIHGVCSEHAEVALLAGRHCIPPVRRRAGTAQIEPKGYVKV